MYKKIITLNYLYTIKAFTKGLFLFAEREFGANEIKFSKIQTKHILLNWRKPARCGKFRIKKERY